jgi:hypothetical protein
MLGIETFFLTSLMTSPDFLSTKPVDDIGLLFPPFLDKLKKSVILYKKSYPDQNIIFIETYRSNTLQEIYYNRGSSKLRQNGMHHYGIAADCMFEIDGQRTFKGDIELLRQIHTFNGLTILGMWDSLHVQFIPVSEQQQLRMNVTTKIKSFQAGYALPVTGEPDVLTIQKAITIFK